jgi:hypothetical protein
MQNVNDRVKTYKYIYIYACVYMYITYNVKYQMNNIKYFMIGL